MLVLRRLQNERIIVGGNIVIELVQVGRGYAKIWIDAPKRITIDREEIHKAKLAGKPKPEAKP